MSSATTPVLYELPDEPRPGPLGHLTVNPFWPLLAFMLGGAFIGWPWHVLNAYALGSASRHRELATAVVGFVVSALLVFGVLFAESAGWLDGRLEIRLALLGVTGWKILVSYVLYSMQARAFALHEHFGGVVRNGGIVALISFFAARRVLDALPTLAVLVLR